MKNEKCFKIRKVEHQYRLYHFQIISIPERKKKTNGEEEIKEYFNKIPKEMSFQMGKSN